MSGLFARLLEIKRILRASRNIPWVKVPPPGQNTVIIYQRAPPLWAKWSHALVALDVMLIGSIIEYTWDIGGFLRRAGTARIDSEPALDTLPFQIFANIQEKSLFKKTIFSGLYFVSGVTFAGALLAWRARILRAVIFHKGNTKTKIPPKFYLQTASHPGDNAIAFSQKECSLVKGDMNSKLLLRVQGHGAWSLTTSGAYIHRKENEATKIDESSRTALIRAWRNAGGHITPSSQ